MSSALQEFDLIIAGAGIVGAACALVCTEARLRVALIERDLLGSGATAAGMGHIVVMDDSEAQFALTRHSQLLWQKLRTELPAPAEYETRGTIWVAADDEEMAEAVRKQKYLRERSVPSCVLTAQELATLEPNLRAGLAGGLLVREDAVVYPPVVAAYLARKAEAAGATLLFGHAVTGLANGEAQLSDGTRLRAPRLLNATGAEAPFCNHNLPVKKRKGHLAITDRYPGFVQHQLVELGYLKSAHSLTADSVAFNVQPRPTGQILIGSSRQYGNDSCDVDHAILAKMLNRASLYMPTINALKILRVWTGFRAATPDKLPLIGPDTNDSTLWLATGHEGLGITTALATAELIASAFTGSKTPIASEPYLPSRFNSAQKSENQEKL
jgi:glycine/D-amino acid oxidase-like deaminating enzyme